MEDHNCIQEKIINRIEKELFGNGKDGLIHIVPVLKDNIDTLCEDMENFRTALSGFTKFMTEVIAVKEFKTKERLNAQQRMKIIISFVLGISGIIVTIILKFA